jgi:3-oxoacyl-[acyl-carrier protein] reductase
VNAKGPWLVAKAAAAALRERQGSIVNIASIAGQVPSGSSLAYAVSKAALIHLTTCLARALAPDVRVNCIAPGLFVTRWTAGFSEEQMQAMIQRSLLKRTVSLEDLARITVEVACNDGMTGETVVVDTGLRWA